MTPGPHSPIDLMIRKLDSLFALAAEEKLALRELPLQVTVLKADQDIVRIGDRPSQCCLILEGFACVYKRTSEGRRQIVAFHIPGDIPDLYSLHLKVMDSSIATMTPCSAGFIQHEDLRRLCERWPRLTAAFWHETLVAASIFREWVLNVGRREAYGRVAHVLCELLVRLNAVGLAQGEAFSCPITQAELADAIGTSHVRVNRVLQRIRGEGLIRCNGTWMHILDWKRLKLVGGFNPLFLHLRPDRAA